MPLDLSALFGSIHIDRSKKSIRPIGRKFFSQHPPPVHVIMMYEVPSKAGDKKSDTYQDATKDIALLVRLNTIAFYDVATTDLEGTNKNLKLTHKCYMLNLETHVQTAPILKKGHNYLPGQADTLPLSHREV